MRLRLVLWPIAAAVSFFLTLVIWGFASPPGSGPDDNDHLPSIWCARGFVEGYCDPGKEGDGFGKAPVPLVLASDCFAYKSEISAACQTELFNWNDSKLVDSVTNENGRFPNGFYWLLHLFISEEILFSAMLMRVFNSALAVAVFFLAFFAIRDDLKIPLIMSWIGSTLPLAMFTIPSTNPSSWTLVGLGTYWATLISFLLEKNPRKKLFVGMITLGTALIALMSRSESGPYLIVITATIIILLQSWKILATREWKSLILPILVVLVSAYEFVTTPSTLGISSGLPGGDQFRSLREVWTVNIMRFPVLYSGALGQWNMGWLDTPTPSITFVFSIFVYSGLLFVGITSMNKYKLLALLFLLFMMAYIPLRILALGKNFVGENVQPRYLLPFLFVLLGISLFMNRREKQIFINTGQLSVIVILLSIAHSFGLHSVMRRYVTGTDVISLNLNNAEWWWNSDPNPMATWILGSFSYTFLLIVAVVYVNKLSKKSKQPQL